MSIPMPAAVDDVVDSSTGGHKTGKPDGPFTRSNIIGTVVGGTNGLAPAWKAKTP